MDHKIRNIQFKILISLEEKEKLESICKLLDVNKSDFIREIINQYGSN